MKSLSIACAVATILACVLAAQAKQKVEKPVFFKDIRGSPKTLKEQEGKVDGRLGVYNGGVAGRNQFPFQAILYIDLSVICGGSLIHEKWVVTAAHCVDGFNIWYVMLGVTESLTPTQDGRRTYVTRGGVHHPNYDSSNIIKDLGLIQLMRPAELNGYIMPIALTPANVNYTGRSGTVSGFGRTDDASAAPLSSVLRYTTLPIVDNQVCVDSYGSPSGDDPSVLCLRADGSSTCRGDSGGPFTVKDDKGNDVLVGAVSYGATAGCTLGNPVGYAKISFFLDWIAYTTGVYSS